MLVGVQPFQTYSSLKQQEDVTPNEGNLIIYTLASRLLTKRPYVGFVAIRYIC